MSEDSWDQARMIPTSGITGTDEQGRRATSAVLAVIGAVREFGRAMLQPLGAPAGAIETFVEVSLGDENRKCFPDGLIRVHHGRQTWTALVEVRTGGTTIDLAQLEALLDAARTHRFDAVLTIGTDGPGPVDRALRDIRLQHYCWSDVLAKATTQQERVADPDRGWILGELVRYLEHPRSGALDFEDQDAAQVVRRVQVTRAGALPEPREPAGEPARRDPRMAVLHTVLIADPPVRVPPGLPSRREVRLVRQLRSGPGEQSEAGNDAGWYQDPQDAGRLRWWDGVGWSERTYPGQPALT